MFSFCRLDVIGMKYASLNQLSSFLKWWVPLPSPIPFFLPKSEVQRHPLFLTVSALTWRIRLMRRDLQFFLYSLNHYRILPCYIPWSPLFILFHNVRSLIHLVNEYSCQTTSRMLVTFFLFHAIKILLFSYGFHCCFFYFVSPFIYLSTFYSFVHLLLLLLWFMYRHFSIFTVVYHILIVLYF